MPLIGPENREQLKTAMRVSAVGIELALSVAVGYFGGRWLDNQLGVSPYLRISGLILGVIAGFHSLYRLTRTVNLDKM
ncbi:MAG: AtpZ/AtpI family protein [Myxococcales bacterium]|nr:AtpZ/AtpI family protein [Myxococcales bacterium]